MEQSSGVVRHIDDLGRIVIPKEIRRTCRIREGDPMEFIVLRASGDLILRKYDPAPSLINDATTLRESINGAVGDFGYSDPDQSKLLKDAEQLVAEACRKLSEFEKINKGE